MDLGPLRTLMLDVSLNVLGVDATVTRPAPDDTPIVTRAIWSGPIDDLQPVGSAFRSREPRLVLNLPRADVPTMPSGTLIQAPDERGGPVQTWQFDSVYAAPTMKGYWPAIVTKVRP